jgi:L-seryl-tRNA(Ser) seleniumtransferase
MNKEKKASFRGLPSVDALLKTEQLESFIQTYGRELTTYAARQSIERARETMKSGSDCPDLNQLVAWSSEIVAGIATPSLIPVINATGVVIHTNLGRAPLGKKVLEDISEVAVGYSNLEFDLEEGERGNRNVHLSRLLTYITGAEASLVVNNNAAGLILALNTLAKAKEVIISRGELIEIGGSFRIPEILAASGAIMVEVGTTNKTRISDYQRALGPDTAIILKAHKSNYQITGFTEEVAIKDLARLSAQHHLTMLYDIGSGLLRRPDRLPLTNEPDVRSALRDGADLVTFSGDKLLGGPQAGIVVGKAELVSRLAKAPMMRALRVGKLTISGLSSVVRSYLDDDSLCADLPFFRTLATDDSELKRRAQGLAAMLDEAGIGATVVRSKAQCGGGTLPGLVIDSYAVALSAEHRSQRARSEFAETVHQRLLALPRPIVGVLRQGEIIFDMLTVQDTELESIASALIAVVSKKVDR